MACSGACTERVVAVCARWLRSGGVRAVAACVRWLRARPRAAAACVRCARRRLQHSSGGTRRWMAKRTSKEDTCSYVSMMARERATSCSCVGSVGLSSPRPASEPQTAWNGRCSASARCAKAVVARGGASGSIGRRVEVTGVAASVAPVAAMHSRTVAVYEVSRS